MKRNNKNSTSIVRQLFSLKESNLSKIINPENQRTIPKGKLCIGFGKTIHTILRIPDCEIDYILIIYKKKFMETSIIANNQDSY